MKCHCQVFNSWQNQPCHGMKREFITPGGRRIHHPSGVRFSPVMNCANVCPKVLFLTNISVYKDTHVYIEMYMYFNRCIHRIWQSKKNNTSQQFSTLSTHVDEPLLVWQLQYQLFSSINQLTVNRNLNRSQPLSPIINHGWLIVSVSLTINSGFNYHSYIIHHHG